MSNTDVVVSNNQGTESIEFKTESTPAVKPQSDVKPQVPQKFLNKDGSTNVDALLKSYTELEKHRSSGTPSSGNEEKKEEDTTTGEEKKSDETKSDENKEGTKEEQKKEEKKEEGTSIPGVTKEDSDNYWKELNSDGKLSEESYTKLEQLGYSREAVTAYTKGLLVDQQIISTNLIKFKGITGSEENYGKMSSWAQSNLSKEDIQEYNEAVNSGKRTITEYAIKSLWSKYQESTGDGGTPLLQGGGNTPVNIGFKSEAERRAAFNDPRYKTDPDYRAEVQSRLARTV